MPRKPRSQKAITAEARRLWAQGMWESRNLVKAEQTISARDLGAASNVLHKRDTKSDRRIIAVAGRERAGREGPIPQRVSKKLWNDPSRKYYSDVGAIKKQALVNAIVLVHLRYAGQAEKLAVLKVPIGRRTAKQAAAIPADYIRDRVADSLPRGARPVEILGLAALKPRSERKGIQVVKRKGSPSRAKKTRRGIR